MAILVKKKHSPFYYADQKRFRVKVGVFLLLFKEKKILLQRRYNTGIEDGLYVVPMGGLKEEETPIQGLIREAQEEINITLHPNNMTLVHTMYRHHTMPDGYRFTQVDLFFKSTHYSGEIINLEPHKADDIDFFDLSALPSNLSPFIKHAIQCIQNNQFFSDFGFDSFKA